MNVCENFRKLASSLPDVEEMPHFEKTSFRVNKKIYATLNEKESRACVKLSENDQHVFFLNDKNVIYPVPNKWGLQGWTLIDLINVEKKLLNEIVKSSYKHVALRIKKGQTKRRSNH